MATTITRPLNAETLKDLLICPITHELIQNPVIDPCGHTFERIDILKWLQEHPRCPLSNQFMSSNDLKPNYMVKDVLDVLAHHDSNLSALEDDEQARVEDGANQILAQRVSDAAIGVLDRLPEDQRRPSLATRIMARSENSIRGCINRC